MIEALDVDEESNHVINVTIESTMDEHLDEEIEYYSAVKQT